MSSLLWKDMRPRRVVGFNQSNGNAIVQDHDKLVEMEMYVSPNSGAHFRFPEPVPIDQLGEREKKSTASRWATSGIDQG